MLGPCIVVQYFVPFLVWHHAAGEERAGWPDFIVIWMLSYSYCYLPLPHSDVGWSVLCDCRISWSNSLAFLILPLLFM